MNLLRKINRLVRSRLQPAIGSFDSSASSLAAGAYGYLDVCRMAPFNSELFRGFRSNPAYTTILEHVTEAQGREYLAQISPDGRAISALAEASKNDKVGGPFTFRLDSGIVVSPTTLRYLKVADDLEKHFGNLDGADVVEIGVGYGGQCRVLDSLFSIKSYTLVDLRPVLNLAAEYLSHFPLRCSVNFATMNELEPRAYDLAISNYAYTELTREVQEAYHRKALQRANRGYITYNDIAPPSYDQLTTEDFRQRYNARILPEIPLTHPKNCIIIWSDNDTKG
jgi:hypothetical protein